MSKDCIFTDPLLITSYVSALLILFFQNKLLFYNDNEQIKPLSFFVCRIQAMLLCLHNRSSQAMLLKTGEAYEAHNKGNLLKTLNGLVQKKCVLLDSECLENNTSVEQKIITNFHLEILQST